MLETFRANIYEVDENDEDGTPISFLDAIRRVCNLPREQRLVSVSGRERRLEHCDEKGGCSLLNFVTLRYAGPRRVHPPRAATRIELADDEFFGHETAMLFDPEERLAFLGTTRPGMGAGAVAQYFRELLTDRRTHFLFTPRLDAEASARWRTKQYIGSVVMRASLGSITSDDHDQGLSAIAALGQEFGAGTIEIEVKAERRAGHSLTLERIRSFIKAAKRAADDGSIDKLRLKGRVHEDDPPELIDLIQHREQRERQLEVDGRERNIPHEVRWKALKSIHRDFVRHVASD